jgi:hypothetical protein
VEIEAAQALEETVEVIEDVEVIVADEVEHQLRCTQQHAQDVKLKQKYHFYRTEESLCTAETVLLHKAVLKEEMIEEALATAQIEDVEAIEEIREVLDLSKNMMLHLLHLVRLMRSLKSSLLESTQN